MPGPSIGRLPCAFGVTAVVKLAALCDPFRQQCSVHRVRVDARRDPRGGLARSARMMLTRRLVRSGRRNIQTTTTAAAAISETPATLAGQPMKASPVSMAGAMIELLATTERRSSPLQWFWCATLALSANWRRFIDKRIAASPRQGWPPAHATSLDGPSAVAARPFGHRPRIPGVLLR